jgi:hypothetical protein
MKEFCAGYSSLTKEAVLLSKEIELKSNQLAA